MKAPPKAKTFSSSSLTERVKSDADNKKRREKRRYHPGRVKNFQKGSDTHG